MKVQLVLSDESPKISYRVNDPLERENMQSLAEQGQVNKADVLFF